MYVRLTGTDWTADPFDSMNSATGRMIGKSSAKDGEFGEEFE
jgi:hypothetical protein